MEEDFIGMRYNITCPHCGHETVDSGAWNIEEGDGFVEVTCEKDWIDENYEGDTTCCKTFFVKFVTGFISKKQANSEKGAREK